MYKFYCPQLGPAARANQKLVDLDASQSHHARRVLRLKPGDQVAAFDGCGLVATGVLCDGADNAGIRVSAFKTHLRDRPFLSVAAAVPKGPRFDHMVNQLCQVGIDQLIPLKTDRAVVAPGTVKIDRVRRIAIEAAKQCGRPFLTTITPLRTVSQVLGEPCDLRMFCDLPAHQVGCDPDNSSNMTSALEQVTGPLRQAERVLILIGPEGGWTDDERKIAKDARCRGWAVNPGILRIETAAVTAAGIVRYITGSVVAV